jgi:hypothetical protein
VSSTSTRTVAVSSAQGWTVRAQGPDGPRPGARRGGALCAGADCPRPGAGRSAAWCAARALPDSRTVRNLGSDGPRVRRGGGRSPAATWISLPGGTPSVRRDPR